MLLRSEEDAAFERDKVLFLDGYVLTLDSETELLEIRRDGLSPEALDVALEERLESFLASVILLGCSFKFCLLTAVAFL